MAPVKVIDLDRTKPSSLEQPFDSSSLFNTGPETPESMGGRNDLSAGAEVISEASVSLS